MSQNFEPLDYGVTTLFKTLDKTAHIWLRSYILFEGKAHEKLDFALKQCHKKYVKNVVLKKF